jgi:uroporphyrinogen decarboxylase
MKQMTKRERLEATLSGAPVDRVAVALWRHWPGDDHNGEELARSTLDFQKVFDFDFMKVTWGAEYCVEDWGVESRYVGNDDGTRQWTKRAVVKPEDWIKLKVLDPRRGLLKESITALNAMRKGAGETPFLQTIFSPLSQAKFLSGDRLMVDIRQHPAAFKAGMEIITESNIRFMEAIKPTGIAGVFFALQYAVYDRMSEAEYREFALPYDLRVLEVAKGLWFNLLHLHDVNVMFNMAATYPVPAINWHDRETPPSLKEAMGIFPGALLGGMRRLDTMQRGTPEKVRAEALDAIEQTGGRRFILSTGCVTAVNTPWQNLRAARQVVEGKM